MKQRFRLGVYPYLYYSNINKAFFYFNLNYTLDLTMLTGLVFGFVF
jgi:hypothetical protein